MRHEGPAPKGAVSSARRGLRAAPRFPLRQSLRALLDGQRSGSEEQAHIQLSRSDQRHPSLTGDSKECFGAEVFLLELYEVAFNVDTIGQDVDVLFSEGFEQR